MLTKGRVSTNGRNLKASKGSRYFPEQDRLATMDKTQLSAWRAVARRSRKNEKQRLRRAEIRASKGVKTSSIYALRYEPPGKYHDA